jgi:hypothetical protein
MPTTGKNSHDRTVRDNSGLAVDCCAGTSGATAASNRRRQPINHLTRGMERNRFLTPPPELAKIGFTEYKK